MEIALTKKLADQVMLNLHPTEKDLNPLFLWTANWTNVYDRDSDNLLVLINKATQFVVTIYPFAKEDFNKFEEICMNAIRKTLQSFNFSSVAIDKYFRLAGDIKFTQNRDRSAASRVGKAGLECAIHISSNLEQGDHIPSETLSGGVNHMPVTLPGSKDYCVPSEEFAKALSELTSEQIFAYRAFELLVTLDLEIYEVKRSLIVPAAIDFFAFHNVIQSVFNWESFHLYDFSIYAEHSLQPIHRLVPYEEDVNHDPTATLLKDQRLEDYLLKYKEILYTYDYGDNWEHKIKLVKVYEKYDGESPYLLHAEGKTPPEDVGGIPGFIYFLEAYKDPNHPAHKELKDWVGIWAPELKDWEKKPRVVR